MITAAVMGGRPLRWLVVAALLVIVSGCTTYQTFEPAAGQSWREAREGRYDARRQVANGRYIVLPGDTLSEIAIRFDTTSRHLAEINGLSSADYIVAGQVLKLDGVRPPERRRPTPSVTPPATPRATDPDIYVVRRGDNLSMIAARHGLTIGEVVRANPRIRPSRLVVGTRLRLPAPNETRYAATTPRTPPGVTQVARDVPVSETPQNEAPTVLVSSEPPQLSGFGFVWPVTGPIVAPYGRFPNGGRNDGINIGAAPGTAVHAAENGVVIYAGDEIKAMGRILLIRHEGDYLTTYAHLGRLHVGVGDHVERGEPIGTVGESGQVAEPQLHFQLRVGTEPLDPSRHLITETKLASR